MKSFVIPIYNRPEYLEQTLNSVQNAKDWHLFVAVEPSDQFLKIQDLLFDYSYKFASMTVDINPNKKGMILNTFDLIEHAFAAGTSFLVCGEDDLYLSPDFCWLMNWYYGTFKSSPLSYGSYGAQCGNVPNAGIDTLTTVDYFTGNGWGVFKENWDAYFAPFWFKNDLAQKHFNAQGNDWNISGVFREYGIKSIAPTLARSKHIGKIGHHFYEAVFDKLCGHLVCNTQYLISDYRLINSETVSHANTFGKNKA